MGTDGTFGGVFVLDSPSFPARTDLVCFSIQLDVPSLIPGAWYEFLDLQIAIASTDINFWGHLDLLTSEMMGRGKKATAEGALRCGNLDCDVTGRDKVNQCCARCLAVRYCSERCQRQHWRRSGGNHRAHCKPPARRGGSAAPRGPPPAATAGGGRDADDPEHPCPICLVNEDDHGRGGMCYECGQLYCGECNVPETALAPERRQPQGPLQTSAEGRRRGRGIRAGVVIATGSTTGGH